MIDYSKLGRYVKTSSESEVIYAFKLVSFDCYETTYIPGDAPFKTSLMNQVDTNSLIDGLIEDSFKQLERVSLVDLHNATTWAKLTLEHYDNIVPETGKKTRQIKI
jgi:hypothetical protein